MSELLSGNGAYSGAGIIETIPRDFKTPKGYVKSAEVFKKSDAPELYRVSGSSPSSTVVGVSSIGPGARNGRSWKTLDGRVLFINTNLAGESKGVYEQKGNDLVLVSDWFSETGLTVEILDHTPGSNDNELLFFWSDTDRARIFYASKSVDYGVTWTHCRIMLRESGTVWGESGITDDAYVSRIKTRWCGDRWVTVLHQHSSRTGARIFVHSKDGVNWVYGGWADNYRLDADTGTGLAYHEPTNTVYFLAMPDSGSDVLRHYFTSVVVNDNMNGNLVIPDGNKLYIQHSDEYHDNYNRSFEIIGDKLVIEVGRRTSSIIVGMPLSKLGTLDTVARKYTDPFFECGGTSGNYSAGACLMASNFSKTAVYHMDSLNTSGYQGAKVISENPDTGLLEIVTIRFPIGRQGSKNNNNLIGRNVHYGIIEFTDLMDPNLYGCAGYVFADSGKVTVFKLV